MKVVKGIFVIIFFLISFNSLFGQPVINDSTEAYGYWSKRGIIEIVYAYMNDYISTVSDSTQPKEKIRNCKNEIIGLVNYQKKFIEKIEYKNIDVINSDFNALSEFLSNNDWPGTNKTLLQPLIYNLKSSKPLNSEFFNTLKSNTSDKSTSIPGYSNKLGYWNETIERILKEYDACIRTITIEPRLQVIKIIPSTVDLEPRQSFSFKAQGFDQFNNQIEIDLTDWKTTSGSITKDGHLTVGKNEGIFRVSVLLDGVSSFAIVNVKKSSLNNSINWIAFIYCITSFILGGLLMYFWVKRKIFKILSQDTSKYLKKVSGDSNYSIISFLSIIELLKERKDAHKQNAAELQRKLENTQNVKSVFQEEKQTHPQEQQTTEPQDNQLNEADVGSVIEWDLPKEKATKPILFFTIPDSEGNFKIEDGKNQNDGNSYYRIEYEVNKNQAFLFYISSELDKRAIDNIDFYLLPVCEIVNISNRKNSNHIKLIDFGIVTIKNGNWAIAANHKVKIKLV